METDLKPLAELLADIHTRMADGAKVPLLLSSLAVALAVQHAAARCHLCVLLSCACSMRFAARL